MTVARRFSTALIVTAAVALVATRARTSSARPLGASPAAAAGEQREIQRIRAHFDSVLSELSASHSATMSSDARARRATLIATLRAYRDRGVFPHNYDFPGRAVPYFVDRRTGTLCAVAYLLSTTGRRDIVNRVAATNNNVLVPELAHDSAFAGWLARNGLSLDDAARIQVPYVQPQTPAQVARNDVFMVVAPVAFGSALVTSLVNLSGNADGHQRLSRILGFSAGAVTLGAAAALASKSDIPPALGLASSAIGGFSIALAARATHRHNALVAQQRDAERARAVQASISPMLGGPTGNGLMLSLRY